jgi:hypothetical protein
LVDVQVELEAHLEQQPPLDHARRDLRRPDGAEEDGVETTELVERLVGQHFTVAQVAPAAEVELGGIEGDAGRPQHLQRLGRHLGADAVAPDDRDSMTHERNLGPQRC